MNNINRAKKNYALFSMTEGIIGAVLWNSIDDAIYNDVWVVTNNIIVDNTFRVTKDATNKSINSIIEELNK